MNLLDQFKKIKTFAFDMDGVLTDGDLFIFDNGQFFRKMNIKDGFGIRMALKKGYRVVVISGGNSDAATIRLKKLGVMDVFMNEENKKAKLDWWLAQNKMTWEETLFMGDDIPDYEAMKNAGLPCAPADAVAEIRQVAKYISPVLGGRGCVRDVIEKVLKLNDHWDLHSNLPSL